MKIINWLGSIRSGWSVGRSVGRFGRLVVGELSICTRCRVGASYCCLFKFFYMVATPGACLHGHNPGSFSHFLKGTTTSVSGVIVWVHFFYLSGYRIWCFILLWGVYPKGVVWAWCIGFFFYSFLLLAVRFDIIISGCLWHGRVGYATGWYGW